MGGVRSGRRGPGWRAIGASAAIALVVAACGDDEAGDDESEAAASADVASGGQFCEGMDITFFPGGAEGGPFESVVFNGAQAAEETFGPDVNYVWSDWDPATMITQFGEAVATDPDGIAIMGHPGEEGFGELIDDAMDEGILVTAMNTELPESHEAHAAEGFGYVGAVLYDAGFDLAQEAIDRAGVESGDRAFLWGLESQAGRGERTQGAHDALDEAGLEVDYLEIDDATNEDPANGIATFTGYVSSNPDVELAIFDHGNLTASIPAYMEAATLGADDLYAAGFDMSPGTVQGIEDGFIDLVIDQQQYLQGYEAVLQLCLTHVYGFSGLFIDTGGGYVDESNIEDVAPLVEEQIR